LLALALGFDFAGWRLAGLLVDRLLRMANVDRRWSSSFILVVVNTKNWYREETDMCAEFGRRAPFGRRFSSKYSVEVSAVGSTSSFGRELFHG
jgi:hypothetical protein